MRYLLANLADCPENMHMEQAFLRYFNPGANGNLDIIHAFRWQYNFIGPAQNKTGCRLDVAGMSKPGDFINISAYDAVIFLDIPSRKDGFLPFLSLLLDRRVKRRVALINHLLAEPGQCRQTDMLVSSGALSRMDIACVFEFEARERCLEMGFREGALLTRTYHIECEYYSPRTPCEAPATQEQGSSYIISAGSAGRDFPALFEAAGRLGVGLKIFTDSDLKIPANCAGKAEVIKFSPNMARMREAIAGSVLVTLPLKDEHINPTAGMAIAFMGMAMEKPVLCRDTEWMRRYIKHGVTGYLYSGMAKEGEFARKMSMAVKDSPNHGRLGRRARKTMLKSANLDKFAAGFIHELENK